MNKLVFYELVNKVSCLNLYINHSVMTMTTFTI
jgi:hypothetical protein